MASLELVRTLVDLALAVFLVYAYLKLVQIEGRRQALEEPNLSMPTVRKEDHFESDDSVTLRVQVRNIGRQAADIRGFYLEGEDLGDGPNYGILPGTAEGQGPDGVWGESLGAEESRTFVVHFPWIDVEGVMDVELVAATERGRDGRRRIGLNEKVLNAQFQPTSNHQQPTPSTQDPIPTA